MCSARSIFCVHTDEASPYSESLAHSTACSVFEARDADHRAKHLALHDFVTLQAARQQGRLVVEPRPGVGRGAGDQFDMRLAERSLDEAGDAIALAATYQRADLVVLIALAGEAQAGNRLAQRVHQLGIDARLRIDAAGGGAVPPAL